MNPPPVVLSLAGLDPSGGAGIIADVQAIAANGGHAAAIVTCLTVQNTRDATEVRPVALDLIRRQWQSLRADLPLAAIKLGVLPDAGCAALVADLLDEAGAVPVVLDPVLIASGGGRLAEHEVIEILRTRLLPRATLTTPNVHEAAALAGDDMPQSLRALGAPAVLVTGADRAGPTVRNTYAGPEGECAWDWPRLPGRYHGSGCTLAAAAATWLARGAGPQAAAEQAQRYVERSLRAGYVPGTGQHVPQRVTPA